MDPALREYLDRMELNAKARADSIIATQQTLSQQITQQSAQLRDLVDWRPDLESRLAHLQGVVADLQRAQLPASTSAGGATVTQIAIPPPAITVEASHRQSGHGAALQPEDSKAVNPGSPLEFPVTGMNALRTPLPTASMDPNLVTNQLMTAMGNTAPAMHFPQFTGENPNLWKTLAEQYFHMFAMHESYWVPMSTLHFKGAAGIWLQAVHKRLAGLDWLSFTSLLCTRFGRD
jgi:hypothetical protein